ncbi:MAG: hypothetical protein OD814_001728, partial [Candidatus Alkanophagales archaeon MCA70_species_1]|nr:hypothetical protein [Candidatus Alkanophaga volatiphilum]
GRAGATPLRLSATLFSLRHVVAEASSRWRLPSWLRERFYADRLPARRSAASALPSPNRIISSAPRPPQEAVSFVVVGNGERNKRITHAAARALRAASLPHRVIALRCSQPDP